MNLVQKIILSQLFIFRQAAIKSSSEQGGHNKDGYKETHTKSVNSGGGVRDLG